MGSVCRGERLTRRGVLKDIAVDFGCSDCGAPEYTAGKAGCILNTATCAVENQIVCDAFNNKLNKGHCIMTLLIWLTFIAAAVLEVGGDALIRKGLRGSSAALIVGGCLILGCYGVLVNIIKWDFSKLLGVYVAFFALISVLFGRVIFREDVPVPTWLGLAFIITGGLIIQFGQKTG